MLKIGKFVAGVVVFIALTGASLWATSLALEPTAYGAAVAPDPANHPDAVIQVYGANVWGFRGRFAIHTWVALKRRAATSYQIYQVIGWRQRHGRPVLSVSEGQPDKPWYGSPAVLLHEIRGAEADSLIWQIEAAVESYPYPREYKMWPGPNSNSFVAWIGLEVPELELRLPVKAIGQTWMKRTHKALAEPQP